MTDTKNPFDSPFVAEAQAARVDANENLSEEELEKQLALQDLVGHVQEKYTFAREDREEHERNWLRADRDVRGEHDAETQVRIAKALERNPFSAQFFLKIAKTKYKAAAASLEDILFAGNKFPIGIEPTIIPDDVLEDATIIPAELEGLEPSFDVPADVVGFEGDGQEFPKGATEQSMLAGITDRLKSLAKGKKILAGPSPDKNQYPQISPAHDAARKMEKQIHDQLEETDAAGALRKASDECSLLGTGCLKGPFNFFKDEIHYDKNPDTGAMELNRTQKLMPKLDAPSIWNIYPDPDATSLQDAEFLVERHLLGKSKLRALKRIPFFEHDAINRLLSTDPGYTEEDWEQQIRDNKQSLSRQRYEVLEYWGMLDEDMAIRFGLDFDPDQELQVNIWVCRDELLKVVVNPFVPQRIPYLLVPYEYNSRQIWGIGVPENMKDSTALMNAHIRGAVDNLNLAGNVVYEVNENQLVPGQDMTVYPGKIWRKQGGAPGQAIFATKYPDTSTSHMVMFDKARQLADESTGIPSFSHGSTNVTGTGRTAAGMSMLMGAASLNIKAVVRNWDHFGLKPLGEFYFQWNMQFNEDVPDIRGDINVVAKGTSSLLQREVQSQRLLQFLQIAGSSELTAPLVNGEYVIKELGKALDLDEDKIINDPVKAKLVAEMLALQKGGGNDINQGTGQAGGSPQGAPGGQGGGTTAGGTNPADPTGAGGGNIGVGSSPQAGEPGFAG
jgi:hypothetical protein